MPEVVIGLPEIDKPVGTLISTDVTVPAPPPPPPPAQVEVAMYREPLEAPTQPVPKLEIVVEPVTFRRVMVVVASVDEAVLNRAPVKDKPVPEAVARVVCPVTVRPVKLGELTTAIVGLVVVVMVMLLPGCVFQSVKYELEPYENTTQVAQVR